MEIVNIWTLDRVNIRINIAFLDKINQKIFLKFKTKRKYYNHILKNDNLSFATFKNMLKKSYIKDFFVPLKVYLKIVKSLKIPKEILQKNIVAYKTANGRNYIENPVLPIIITPVFDMLLAHHMGDGTVVNPGKGRLPYFGYRQFDKFYRIQYIRKIEDIVGKIKFKENYFERSTRPYCPPVLSTLFFKYYKTSVEDFLSERARIPKIIFDKGKESMLSFLIAFIIDEGTIDSTQITIRIKNPLLVGDLNKICNILGYKSKITCGKKDSEGYSSLHILREGMKGLYNDYKLLNKRYPIIDFGKKGEKIKNSFKIYNRDIYKTKGNREIILEILKKEQLSVNQLAERLNMTRQGVRQHINNLIKEKEIKLIDNTHQNWVYGI